MQEREVPVWARVYLTHAALQDAADTAGVDILHIKGPTLDPLLRPGRHHSSDADVLVRPAHLKRFVRVLENRRWTLYTSFAEGSPFGHAANYRHPQLSYADVHRLLPGPHAPAAEVFDALWQDHTTKQIAHRACTTPGLAGQVFVQVLHAARSHGGGPAGAWTLADDDLRADVRHLAERLDAEVVLAAGIGELDEHADARDHDLWAYWSSPEHGRLDEWRGRWKAAAGAGERMRVLSQAARVNRAHLAMRLGHEPTRAEVRQEQAARVRKLWAALRRRT